MDECVVVRLIDIEILFYLRWHGLVDHFVDKLPWFLGIDRLVAISVNNLALHIHHVVEIECSFSNQIIALLHTFLRGLDRLVKPPMLQLLPFLESETLHDFCHPIRRAEVAHQIVFETDVESRCAWIPLARATSTQLSIDPA